MSFAGDVRGEIIENKPLRARYRKAQAYGLFLFAHAFGADEMCLRTESVELAELYEWLAKSLAGRQIRTEQRKRRERGKTLYTVLIPLQKDRERLLSVLGHRDNVFNMAVIPMPEHLHAFLAGAWLACGGITDPEKGYHLEFAVKDAALCDVLMELLGRCTRGAGRITRRGAHILYYKEVAEIEDLLTMMGATRASLAMIEVEMLKDVRNKANRVTNCETANIEKMVNASTGQVADIRYILAKKGGDWLPDNLRDAARVRLENPDLSLRELAELMPGKISRSGMHHRLDRLQRLAAGLRAENGGE